MYMGYVGLGIGLRKSVWDKGCRVKKVYMGYVGQGCRVKVSVG